MSKSKPILKKQKLLLLSITISGLIVVIAFSCFSMKTKNVASVKPPPQVDLPVDTISPQEAWMSRVESENKIVEQKLKYIEEIILTNKKNEAESEKERSELQREIGRLKEELKAVVEKPIAYVETIEPEEPFMGAVLQEIIVESPPEPIASNVEVAIPAGTTVKALLVSSVDATCGVNANSDPIPVKLRILDDAHLPKAVKVLLKGGLLIGSSYGNLSSERVYMRLEKLTQVVPSGDFVETDVAGYVSGEDGKYGIRGTVVDKSCKIIANAAVSGLFAETSQVLQSALGRYTIDTFMSNQSGVAHDSLQQKAFGRGPNAFDMLADYYIQRAEQVMPVIQVSAGRVVDVTFTHGVVFGDLHTKENIQHLRDKTRGME